MDPGFRHIDHTADVGLSLTAHTAAGLFVVATHGLHALWGLPATAGPAPPGRETLEVTGADTEALLVAWLNELIFQADVHARVTAAMDEPVLTAGRFRAQVAWRPLDWTACDGGVDIKAATFHTLAVRETSGGVTTTIIFDV